MDSAYSTKVSQLFTKGSHHRNISLVLITQNFFYQGPFARGSSLNSEYIVVLSNPRDKTQIVSLARQVYPENFSSFHKTYLDVSKDPHTYLLLDLTQWINDLLRLRTKTFPEETTEVFAPVRGNERVKVTATLFVPSSIFHTTTSHRLQLSSSETLSPGSTGTKQSNWQL